MLRFCHAAWHQHRLFDRIRNIRIAGCSRPSGALGASILVGRVSSGALRTPLLRFVRLLLRAKDPKCSYLLYLRPVFKKNRPQATGWDVHQAVELHFASHDVDVEEDARLAQRLAREGAGPAAGTSSRPAADDGMVRGLSPRRASLVSSRRAYRRPRGAQVDVEGVRAPMPTKRERLIGGDDDYPGPLRGMFGGALGAMMGGLNPRAPVHILDPFANFSRDVRRKQAGGNGEDLRLPA